MEDLDFNEFYSLSQEIEMNLDLEKSNIMQNIEKGKGIAITFYSLPMDIEVLIQFTLNKILKKYSRLENEEVIYNVVFESIVNGLKANGKKLYFIENGLDIYNPEDYQKGMILFKKNITKLKFKDSSGANKDKNLFVRIMFTHSVNGMEVEVINNTLILPSEEDRIREKLKVGGKYTDLMSYYMDCSDESEGEGLGLVLSLILLRGMGIDSSLFRIGKRENVTFARIEVPFSNEFQGKR